MDLKNYQNKLFPYAYNILGSVEDAKDVVQDVVTKYLSLERKTIENETGYLIKSIINRSINLKNHKHKTTTNKVWLPEPFSTEDVADSIDRDTILSYSLLTLLEKLTAKERAVFILKEAFDFSHKEIAESIDSSVENSRKILSRARIKLTDYRTAQNNQLHNTSYLNRYLETIKNGNVSDLKELLSEDILLAADGGENIKVVRELTTGVFATSKLLVYVYKAFLSGLKYKVSFVNHQPAILFYQNDVLYNCQVFELHNKKIRSIYSIVDPQKLKALF